MSSPANARNVVRLGIIYTIGSFAPQIVNLALTPLFTRFLSLAQMGIVYQAARCVGPITLIAQLGFFAFLKGRYFQYPSHDRGNLVRTVVIGQSLIALTICILLSLAGIIPTDWFPAGWIAHGETVAAELFLPGLPFDHWHAVFVLWLLVVWQAFCDGLFNLGSGVAQLQERARLSVGLNWTRYLLHAGLGLVVVVGLGGLGLARQATIFAGCAISGVVSLLLILPSGRGVFNRQVFRAAFVGGISFVPHAFASMAPQAVTVWLLGRHLGSAANGIYGAAVLLPALTETVMYAINNAVYPTLARLMSERTDTARRQQAQVYTLMILGIVTLQVTIAITAPLALRVLLAPTFWAAIDYVPILALAWLFYGLYQCASQPVFYVGGGWWLSLASTLAALTHFAAAVSIIPHHGLTAACWSLVAGNFVLFLTSAIAGYRLYPIPWETRKLVTLVAAAVALVLADRALCQDLAWYATIPVKTVLLAAWLPLLRVTQVLSAGQLQAGVQYARQYVGR